MEITIKIPPHLKRVATLPCEIPGLCYFADNISLGSVATRLMYVWWHLR